MAVVCRVSVLFARIPTIFRLRYCPTISNPLSNFIHQRVPPFAAPKYLLPSPI